MSDKAVIVSKDEYAGLWEFLNHQRYGDAIGFTNIIIPGLNWRVFWTLNEKYHGLYPTVDDAVNAMNRDCGEALS